MRTRSNAESPQPMITRQKPVKLRRIGHAVANIPRQTMRRLRAAGEPRFERADARGDHDRARREAVAPGDEREVSVAFFERGHMRVAVDRRFEWPAAEERAKKIFGEYLWESADIEKVFFRVQRVRLCRPASGIESTIWADAPRIPA